MSAQRRSSVDHDVCCELLGGKHDRAQRNEAKNREVAVRIHLDRPVFDPMHRIAGAYSNKAVDFF